MLLLAASGGFRPGVVENVKYRQVSIQMVRDPKTQETRLVATITLYENKQRKNGEACPKHPFTVEKGLEKEGDFPTFLS